MPVQPLNELFPTHRGSTQMLFPTSKPEYPHSGPKNLQISPKSSYPSAIASAILIFPTLAFTSRPGTIVMNRSNPPRYQGITPSS